jgi:preprotein translocase subunit SecG
MQMILTVLQLLLSLGLIGLVLIQHGRGADAGAAFGSGASATVFGARGSGSFLSRATGILATLFFLTSMALAYYAAQSGRVADLMDGVQHEEAAVEAPAVEMPQVPVPGSAEGSVPPPTPVEGPAPPGPQADGSAIPAPPAPSGAPAVPAPTGE